MSKAQELEELLKSIEAKSNKDKVEEFLSRSKDIIKSKSELRELKGEEIVAIARGIGWILTIEKVKKAQMRKFLDMVNRLKTQFDLDQAVMLRYRMAYAVSREKGLKVFMQIIEPALKKVKEKVDFERLARLVEAIVAYHAFYGGKD